MSYRLNKTDGSLLVDLIDGEIDQNSTDITLIGRNYEGFGEFFNENLIFMLENFASTTAPSNPLTGQLWYDTSSGRMKVFDGTEFISTGAPLFGNDFPNNPVIGDVFINSQDQQMFFYSGKSWILVGPIYKASQGQTGLETETILDSLGRSQVILRLFIQGTLAGIYSNNEFSPAPGSEISGITPPIQAGFTPINSNFQFNGTSFSSFNLITESGELKKPESFLPADSDGLIIGALTIQSNDGIVIGTAQNSIQRVVNNSTDGDLSFVNETNLKDQDYRIRVLPSDPQYGDNLIDAITVDTSELRVGIFQESPKYTLDVSGDLRVAGNFLVEGNTTNIDVTDLRVEDRQIELAYASDSTVFDDSQVDDAGILVKSSGGNKSFVWKNLTNAWTSNTNIDLKAGQSYLVNGNQVLSETELTNVTDALDLEKIGTLQYLDVDNVNIDGTTITTSSGMNLTSAGPITINNQRVTGVASPTSVTDATNKNYVDDLFATAPVYLEMNITGLADSDIANRLSTLIPVTTTNNGKKVYLTTINFNNSTVSGIQVDLRNQTSTDNGEVLVYEMVSVDKNGTENQPVVRSISQSNDASGNVNITIARGYKTFRVDSGSWTWVADSIV